MHLANLSKSRVYIKGDLQNEEVKDITFLIPKHTKATISTKHDMHVIFEEIHLSAYKFWSDCLSFSMSKDFFSSKLFTSILIVSSHTVFTIICGDVWYAQIISCKDGHHHLPKLALPPTNDLDKSITIVMVPSPI